MFWRKVEEEVIERPVDPLLPAGATGANGPGERDEVLTVDWSGPFSDQDEAPDDAINAGFFWIVGRVYGTGAQEDRIGHKVGGLFGYAQGQYEEQDFASDQTQFWIGKVVRGNRQIKDYAGLERAKRALIFHYQPQNNVKHRARLFIKQRGDVPKSAKLEIFGANAIAPLPQNRLLAPEPKQVRRFGAWMVLLLGFFVGGAAWLFSGSDGMTGLRQVERGALSVAMTPTANHNRVVKRLENELQVATGERDAVHTTLDRVTEANVDLRARNTTLNFINEKLEGKIALLGDQSIGQPIELTSCWPGGAKNYAPVYRIVIQDGAFVVSPAWAGSGMSWPARQAETMRAFDHKPLASGATLNAREFEVAMRPYYDFGVGEKKCRFFVEVVDSTTAKGPWKSGLATVEKYFYKKLL
jgi:hypothetical protein